MNYLILAIGLLLLLKGADVLVDAASKIAKILKVPAFIVGLLIVAMGTSAPEAAIGVFSGIQGTNIITLGDVIGSSIVNITVVLAITAIIFPLKVDSLVPRRELPLSVLIQVVLIIMLSTSFQLSRIEAAVLLIGMIVFAGYITSKSKQLLKNEKPDTVFENEVFEYIEDLDVLQEDVVVEKRDSILRHIAFFLLGLAGLIGGSNLVVTNAITIAQSLGLSEAFIGLTVVALGTSLPELVTCLIAAIKKESAIAVGNIIGSNIFNVLFVLGVSGILHPVSITPDIYFDLAAMLVTSVLLIIPTFFFGRISRRSGFILVSVYVIYLLIKIYSLA